MQVIAVFKAASSNTKFCLKFLSSGSGGSGDESRSPTPDRSRSKKSASPPPKKKRQAIASDDDEEDEEDEDLVRRGHSLMTSRNLKPYLFSWGQPRRLL